MGVLKCLTLNNERNWISSNVDFNAGQGESKCTFLNCKDFSKRICQRKKQHGCGTNNEIGDFVLPGNYHLTTSKYHLTTSKYHLYVGDVHVFIPRNNVNGSVDSDFGLKMINDGDFCLPTVSPTQFICAPIVHITPHGSQFYRTDPAIIILPLNVRLNANDVITCLCSDTNSHEDPVWELLHPNQYKVCGAFVKLRTTHFSFYTVVVNKHYPESRKMIYAGVGDVLEIPEVPGVKVVFPGSAVNYDIEATIKVMYADEVYDVDHNDPTSYALAAPVVKLGPTGHSFDSDNVEPVEIQLPLPHGKEIFENCGRPHLTFWQSTTAEGQELNWKPLKTKYQKIEDEDNRLYVRFSVKHFTFFKALWSVLDSAIHEAKIGASFFYPNFQFCISFQAFMSENTGDETFGLCCLCYRKGTTPQSIGNYPVFIGSSGLRMVKSGLLQIRIVSNLFQANADFGEAALKQREVFTGRPFDKQFACKFTVPRTPEQSIIGKIYIERILDNSETEPLFDFILTKPSSSQERSSNRHDDQPNTSGAVGLDQQANWEGQLSQELANILSIRTEQDLGDDVWEGIARALGYTPLEIDMKFKDLDQPFTKLLEDYKKRGGSPNDFISAMYSVGRNANLSNFERRIRDVLPSSDVSEVEDDVAACAGSISPSRTSSSSGIVLPSSPINSRKRRYTGIPEGPIPDSKLTEVAERVQNKWKRLGRTLELREDQITEIERNYKDDGIQEQAYQMLLTWRECYPDNGYATLFQALGKLNLNAVANQLYHDS